MTDPPRSLNPNTDTWRQGYLGAQRNPFGSNRAEFDKRLMALGVLDLPRQAKILDFGSGDGSIMEVLAAHGFRDVIGLEPDEVLVRSSSFPKRTIVGGGPNLCFAEHSFDAVLCMAVLHHLPSFEDLERTIADLFRMLRPGGVLFCVEPAHTMVRSVLTPILLSPLSLVTEYSRKKRMMVLDEWDTLSLWLTWERRFAQDLIRAKGFEVTMERRGLLKTYLRATKPAA